ncbi:MAG: hypothetical protein COT00_02410 [Candidatus Omnitrophica bacterium CG07_land_8_20_14_0_80_50_8]|nr:MAG: hypothetical protein COT00_02410 [Candidatus Omnitrophica bacterium CG07_land_8_20_14_0_80_50_8]
MIRSIRFVLTLWYLGILTVILCVFSSTLYSKVSANLNRHINETLAAQADAIEDNIFAFWKAEHEIYKTDTIRKEIQVGRFPALIDRWSAQTNELEDHFLRLIDHKGVILAASKHFSEFNLKLDESILRKTLKHRTSYQTIKQGKSHFQLITRPIIEDGQLLYIVQMTVSRRQAETSLEQLRDWLFWLVPATILLTSAIGWFLVTATLRPVGYMIKKVQSIGIQDLQERIEVPDTHDELEQLATTFNGLLSRLDKSFRRMRQFSAAAAHELRTPLSIMKGELEVTLRKERENAEYRRLLYGQLEVLTELANIVDQLLALAYAEEGEEAIQWKEIQLGPLIRSVIESWRKVAEAKELTIDLVERDTSLIRGEKRLLERLVANFLDNAIKHTPAKGKIRMEVVRRKGEVCIVVQDTGPGITPEELPKIFDKFFSHAKRDKSDSSGVGLGLGLCRWIAESHKGKIAVESAPGHGATFIISFPAISATEEMGRLRVC